MRIVLSAAALAALALPPARAAAATTQPPPAAPLACHVPHNSPLTGAVRDSTAALIPGATLTLDSLPPTTSGPDGRFRFPCLAPGPHHLAVTAPGFSSLTLDLTLPHPADLALVLQPATVQIGVEVDADASTNADTQGTSASHTLEGKQLQSLADDPDDLLRQLQQLAAAAGGSPANTTISVDGFNDSSKLPPKSSIAYIKVNPDQFSAEYREPPFDGGRVEVYTKPGQPAFHGALFATNSSSWMNAADPFATSKAPLGKQRYGFELTGPITRDNSDFSLTLEHRSIDNFGVVNATSLDTAGNPISIVQNIAMPQRLWVGQARVDLQLGPKNTFVATYSPNVNSLQNVGVGGLNLAETGYNEGDYEHVLRFLNITTISPHLMHEARLQLRWDGSTDVPNSTTPQVQVAGAFTGGGNTAGNNRLARFVPEIIDGIILTTKRHTLKAGTDITITHDAIQATTNFNGTYTFGGSSTAPVLDANGNVIPGQTETITGTQQYQRALLNQPGGIPTAYASVTGTPAERFTQTNAAFYIQDDFNVGHGVHLSGGLRYFYQSLPSLTNGATPRFGILWSPTKNGAWTLHAHAGLFTGRLPPRVVAEVLREDGVNRITRTVYNPTFCDPNAPAGSTCNPFTGATPILSARQFIPGLGQLSWGAWNLGGTRTLPGGWNLSLDWYDGRLWNEMRSVNINAPLNGSPTGPRAAGIPNLNLLQVNNSGQGHVTATFAGIEQHHYKRLQFFFGGVRVQLIDDTDDNPLASPQSSFSNAGEFAHRTDQPVWNLFGNANLTLPRKLVLSANFNGSGDAHYNITTGYDNNGDGNFNDRPQYAAPGTPNAIQTPFGLLVDSGGTGVFPRNKGVMPWTFYLDANLQRAFPLNNPKADHPQTLTVNLRSSNLLNHTNVTAVGGVLGSPTFTLPYAADNGRRVEAGLRYTF